MLSVKGEINLRIKKGKYEIPEFEEIEYSAEDVLTNTGEQNPTSEWDENIIRD